MKCLNCNEDILRKNGKRGKKYCSNKCQQEYRYKGFIKRWKNGEEKGMSGKYSISASIRRFLFDKYDNKCSKCEWSEVNEFSGNIPLEVDHIDGDYTNNKEKNLRLLCPNCHSLTSTYRRLNKNGRKGRKKYN